MKNQLYIVLFFSLLFIQTLAEIGDDDDSTSSENSNKKEEKDDEDDGFDTNFRGDNVHPSFIENSFKNQNSFSCQLVKNALRTGDSGANLSPEDIKIIGAMGDALSTGIGLWGGLDVEFRGAAFTVGGDATIDGLVTFPNILSAFSPHLEGISHGMGTSENLPDTQFNVAKINAESDTMPGQANELVRRLHLHYTDEELTKKWVMVIITVGTEELCNKCQKPNIAHLRTALITLKRGISKAFVVIIGPIHVARSSLLNYNLLKPRCNCLAKLSNQGLHTIQNQWSEELLKLEVDFSSRKYKTFTVLTLPKLTIESRNPEQLFISKRPLLNKKGHTYAAKWLWNRLISGPKYNRSKILFSEESYYCPPVACPYFRTPSNIEKCRIMTLHEYKNKQHQAETAQQLLHQKNLTSLDLRRDSIKRYIALWIAGPVLLSTVVVFILGAGFYMHGMKATKGRFENIPGV